VSVVAHGAKREASQCHLRRSGVVLCVEFQKLINQKRLLILVVVILTNRLIMLLSNSVLEKMPIRKAEAYDSEMLVHFGFGRCRCEHVPGNTNLLER
jgi:hypothetical protein